MKAAKPLAGLNRRIFFQSCAALSASLVWPFPALAQTEPVQPPYKCKMFVQDIIDLCARYYGTTRDAVLSPLREKREVMARQSAMYIARRLTDRSLSDIGRRTGARMPTTVLYAEQKISALIESDPLRRRDIDVLSEAAHRIARFRIEREHGLEDPIWNRI